MTKNDEGFNGATTLYWQFPVGAGEEPGSDGAVVLALVEQNAEGRPEVQAFEVDAAGEVYSRWTSVVKHGCWAEAANDAILRLLIQEVDKPKTVSADFEAFLVESATRKVIARRVELADAKLAEFAASFAKDAAYALEWGESAVEAAAVKKVFARALAVLAKHSVEDYFAEVRAEVLRAAKSSSRSTSAMSNEMARAVLAAQAELLEILESAI